MSNHLEEVELFAWIGEDEAGSGVIGLKQAYTPAGLIPLVATNQSKMDQDYMIQQLQHQANNFGKTIRLCRFRLVSEVVNLKPQEQSEVAGT